MVETKVVEINAPVLKTGDRFIARSKGKEQAEYEFVGFAPFDSCGCQYIIIKNVSTGEYAGVERLWFDESYCGRHIKLASKK